MQLNPPIPRSQLPSLLRCPSQTKVTVCPQQPLEATCPSSSLATINRQSTGLAELAFPREQVPFQQGKKKKKNICFVVHTFGLNEPKTACQGTELFPKPDPSRHLTSRAGSEAGAAAGDLPWQPRLCHVPTRCSHRSPAKGNKVGGGTGVPPPWGAQWALASKDRAAGSEPPAAPPEGVSDQVRSSSSQPGQEAPLHPPQAGGCPAVWGRRQQRDLSTLRGGSVWTSAPVLQHEKKLCATSAHRGAVTLCNSPG